MRARVLQFQRLYWVINKEKCVSRFRCVCYFGEWARFDDTLNKAHSLCNEGLIKLYFFVVANE